MADKDKPFDKEKLRYGYYKYLFLIASNAKLIAYVLICLLVVAAMFVSAPTYLQTAGKSKVWLTTVFPLVTSVLFIVMSISLGLILIIGYSLFFLGSLGSLNTSEGMKWVLLYIMLIVLAVYLVNSTPTSTSVLMNMTNSS